MANDDDGGRNASDDDEKDDDVEASRYAFLQEADVRSELDASNATVNDACHCFELIQRKSFKDWRKRLVMEVSIHSVMPTGRQ
ncbi:hypothetical protein SARC_13849 [Sphaeroforma arctica JP610]|uniref:Uncharacterized protein n=1 Tax=Sphaeroforma arctica JP610 TaxID=667725 RepID=A0A0L0FAR6_9EUKA|nr:hypothetical protein SARC_13849 [Sphaeroforma arctica JP610]KNC73591.1 hypothetical protein SARC_13849 [Sphaeroforma arctica JP610]|eukprot:XP_014147493.1 hypothetical protein SARC_13849 [Sphaeroforma arctica JP610]